MVSKRFKFSSTKPFPFFRFFDEIARRLPQESRNFSERWNDHKYEMSRTFLNPNPETRFLLRKLAKKIIIVHSSQEMPSILSIIITQDSMSKSIKRTSTHISFSKYFHCFCLLSGINLLLNACQPSRRSYNWFLFYFLQSRFSKEIISLKIRLLSLDADGLSFCDAVKWNGKLSYG